VDIFFDHFLSRHWADYMDDPLPVFLEEIQAALARHPAWLGDALARVAPRMRDEKWLQSYLSIDGLDLTFGRVADRSSRLGPIRTATDDLGIHYQSFERAFHQFFPDARRHASHLIAISCDPPLSSHDIPASRYHPGGR
jgi:acyl carrier protein phosphodiesterase